MFRAVGVLVIFTVQKSLVNCFPDLTPEAITVYRNPEFFKNLYYGHYDRDETTTESSRGEETEENYKYPGETSRPHKPVDSPGLEVTYDNSPEFQHDPRDVEQTPFRPPKRKGPYSPQYDAESVYDENAESYNNDENNATYNSEENSQKSSDENIKENTEDAEDNFRKNSEENSETNLEENTEITPDYSNESANRNSNNDENDSEENVEESSRNSEEDGSTNASSEEETEDNKEETKRENDDRNSSESSEEIQERSPQSLVTPDEALEAEEEPAEYFNPLKVSDLSKSLYNQPYPFNATHPILYDNWKHYNFPKISSLDFKKTKIPPPYAEEPSSNTFYETHDDDDEKEAEGSDSFENLDTSDMGTDTKRIYKKLLRHKKLKPSLLLEYHSKPKLKKLKVKLKKGKLAGSWFDLHPFNF